jgi:hypothetical protein
MMIKLVSKDGVVVHPLQRNLKVQIKENGLFPLDNKTRNKPHGDDLKR